MTVLIVPTEDPEPWPTLGPHVCAFIEQNLVYGPGDLLGLPIQLDQEKRGFVWKWYELYRRAVIGGYPDGEFKGDNEVNRAEAAKFLLLARFGTVDELTNNGRFPDVLDGEWYVKFVIFAADEGIISGHPDGLFLPANTLK